MLQALVRVEPACLLEIKHSAQQVSRELSEPEALGVCDDWSLLEDFHVVIIIVVRLLKERMPARDQDIHYDPSAPDVH